MKTFEVSLRFQDRNNNSEESTVKLDASSIPGAIAKATREFVKKLDRKQRFDMNKNGLEIKAVCIGAGGAEKQSAQAESA
jgi:transcription initiation factor IIE alpha subunit